MLKFAAFFRRADGGIGGAAPDDRFLPRDVPVAVLSASPARLPIAPSCACSDGCRVVAPVLPLATAAWRSAGARRAPARRPERPAARACAPVSRSVVLYAGGAAASGSRRWRSAAAGARSAP